MISSVSVRLSVSVRAVGLAVLLAVPSIGQAQQTVTVPSSTHYERGSLWRKLFGDMWRDEWAVPVEIPVLNFDTFAGGLEPYKQGGNQSKTLRMHGADGRTYVFRTTDKNIQKAMPEDLRHTPMGRVVQDQTASFHPSAPVAVAVMSQALGLLTAPPKAVYITDDKHLGKFRDDFKNTPGQIEERPEDRKKGDDFYGSKKIVSTEKLLEELEQSTKNKVDEPEYLKARLLDFIIGDTDRGADQWNWAKYEQGDLNIYKPIARDRDYAFMRTEGFITSMGARIYPKLTRYRAEFPKLRALIFMTREFDRSHLVAVSRPQWDSVVTDIQHRLTDDVIERAIAQIPLPQRKISEDLIRLGLRTRRDSLKVMSEQFYRLVNEDAAIWGSDDDEIGEIDRNADGTVRVRIYRKGEKASSDDRDPPVFDRTFSPTETQELYVHMERGDDYVVVRGNVPESIQLRVMGGEGDDVLIDSGNVADGDETRFYDSSGHNQLVAGAHTDIRTKPYVTLQPKRSLDDDEKLEPEENPRKIFEERRGRYQDLMNTAQGYVEKKTRAEYTRMWGKKSAFGALFAYRDGPGVILGFGPTTTEFGFRRHPYESQVNFRGMYGIGSSGFGVQMTADKRFEVSPWSVSLFAQASQLGSNRFFGYGNNTLFEDEDYSLVMRDEVVVQPSLNYWLSKKSRITAGPAFKLERAHPDPNGLAAAAHILGTQGTYKQVGGRAELVLMSATRTTTTQRGIDLTLGTSVYPAVLDVNKAFSEAHGVAKVFVPLGRPTLAFRAGGQRVWGTFPLHEAAFIGAAESVRGYRWNRFAGDASAYGSAELHVPVGRVTLLTRGDVGLIAFYDAGRVWRDGNSAGDWHTGTGGGLWFGTLGQALSVTYAKGEEGRLYLSLGLPF